MQVTAKVTIQNSTYEAWYNFFLSYAEKRAEFVQNEIVEKLSANEARVSFEITNLEGLTDLSKMSGRTADFVCATSTAIAGQNLEENDQVKVL